ncbi:hypothetical protein Dimus_004138, partial [Dionaea muscipula]
MLHWLVDFELEEECLTRRLDGLHRRRWLALRRRSPKENGDGRAQRVDFPGHVRDSIFPGHVNDPLPTMEKVADEREDTVEREAES